MEQEKIKLKELIQQELAMVTQYSHQPAYYVQVNKNGCRIVVKVDDIPLGYNFAEDEGRRCSILSMITYLAVVNIF